LSEEYISVSEMRRLEYNSEYLGVSRLQLMENAGRGVAEEVSKRAERGSSVAVLCGTGGNGGDGMVAARFLASWGFDVSVYLVGREEAIRSEETRRNWVAVKLMDSSLKVRVLKDSSNVAEVAEADVYVDAMLGIGAKSVLRPPILQAVRRVNELEGLKLAVDVPTGIDADTGEVLGEAFRADVTVTFHKPKTGMKEASEYVGELVVKDIGIPPEAEAYVGPGDVIVARKPRRPTSHKGEFGRLLVVGGSETYTGAPALVALAALRCGVDLVYVAAPERTAYTIASMSPNLITVKLEGAHLTPRGVATLEPYLRKATAVVLGPGLGLHRDTFEAVKELVELFNEHKVPVVMDADGLKAFAEFKSRVEFPLVLTPHAGEYRILTGHAPEGGLQEVGEDVREEADKLGATILLKGHVDVISDGRRVRYNRTGNPGMTVGGTGDTLSGIVGALMAQGFDPFTSACAGAFINGAAGDLAVEELGYHIVPTDIIDRIPKVMDNPMEHKRIIERRATR